MTTTCCDLPASMCRCPWMPPSRILSEGELRAAGVRLHFGSHLGLLSEKVRRGFFDAAGFWSDEEVDAFLDMAGREERAWRDAEWAWHRLPLDEKRLAFGLMIEAAPAGGSRIDKEEVRRRVDIVELAGQFTRLRVVGDRASGRCFLHEDKMPSFSVDRKKGLWHCFSCGEGGDVFSLIMRRFDCNFKTAVEIASRL